MRVLLIAARNQETKNGLAVVVEMMGRQTNFGRRETFLKVAWLRNISPASLEVLQRQVGCYVVAEFQPNGELAGLPFGTKEAVPAPEWLALLKAMDADGGKSNG